MTRRYVLLAVAGCCSHQTTNLGVASSNLAGRTLFPLLSAQISPHGGVLAIDKGSARVVGSRVFKSGILERGITMSIKSFMSIVFTCTAAATFVAGTALAADPAVKCESGKLKESSKYSACRLKADAKAVTKGITADYAKCEAKFADKWTKAENKAGAGNCPSEGDQVSMDARITTDVAEVATLLAGGSVTDCSAELSTCTGSLSTCNGALTNCVGVDVPAALEAGCVAGGGTWAAGTSTCTAASSYNCFIGGFCAKAAIDYPTATYGWINLYEGHTEGTEPALGAGCNNPPTNGFPSAWASGHSAFAEASYVSCFSTEFCDTFNNFLGPCASN